MLHTSDDTDNAMTKHRRLDHRALLLTRTCRRSELAQMVRAALGTPGHASIVASRELAR
jgi:hypothetical protein